MFPDALVNHVDQVDEGEIRSKVARLVEEFAGGSGFVEANAIENFVGFFRGVRDVMSTLVGSASERQTDLTKRRQLVSVGGLPEA